MPWPAVRKPDRAGGHVSGKDKGLRIGQAAIRPGPRPDRNASPGRAGFHERRWPWTQSPRAANDGIVGSSPPRAWGWTAQAVFVPTSCKSRTKGSIADKTAGPTASASNRGGHASNPRNINAKRPLSSSDNGRPESGRRDSNPRPLDPQSKTPESQLSVKKEVTGPDKVACTSACTKGVGKGQNRDNRLSVIADLLADLPETERREVIAELSAGDRVTIARMLIGRN